jgi:hypothetical protein
MDREERQGHWTTGGLGFPAKETRKIGGIMSLYEGQIITYVCPICSAESDSRGAVRVELFYTMEPKTPPPFKACTREGKANSNEESPVSYDARVCSACAEKTTVFWEGLRKGAWSEDETPLALPKLPRPVAHGIAWLLIKIGSWSHSRFDEHLRYEFGDAFTDEAMAWLGKHVAPKLGKGPDEKPRYVTR